MPLWSWGKLHVIDHKLKLRVMVIVLAHTSVAWVHCVVLGMFLFIDLLSRFDLKAQHLFFSKTLTFFIPIRHSDVHKLLVYWSCSSDSHVNLSHLIITAVSYKWFGLKFFFFLMSDKNRSLKNKDKRGPSNQQLQTLVLVLYLLHFSCNHWLITWPQ